MKIIIENEGRYILRFDTGEEVIAGLAAFAREQHITAATFSMIGASKVLVLAYYALDEKRYEDHEFREDLEIVTVTGNIGRLNGEPLIHAHGVFGKRDLSTVGGHVKSLVISATGEVSLTALSGEITRGYDEPSGLNLIQ